MSRYKPYYKKNASTSRERDSCTDLRPEETDEQWVERLYGYGFTDHDVQHFKMVRSYEDFLDYCDKYLDPKTKPLGLFRKPRG